MAKSILFNVSEFGISKKSVSGRTSANGNISTGLPDTGCVVVNGSFEGMNSTPFTQGGIWYLKIFRNAAFEPIANTNVSGTVYFVNLV